MPQDNNGSINKITENLLIIITIQWVDCLYVFSFPHQGNDRNLDSNVLLLLMSIIWGLD